MLQLKNAIGGHAYRPADVITTLSGKTVEVLNTDAEGRVILADGLTYIQRNYQPKAIIDLATLTGAIIVALGHHRSGLFSNNDKLAQSISKAGKAAIEEVWRMPMDDEYKELIKSSLADIQNIGQGSQAMSITAAAFFRGIY